MKTIYQYSKHLKNRGLLVFALSLIGILFTNKTWSGEKDSTSASPQKGAKMETASIPPSQCAEIIENKEDGSIETSFTASRLMFHMKKEDPHFAEYKAMLIDARANKKDLELTYDVESQKIISLKFSANKSVNNSANKSSNKKVPQSN